MPSAYARRVWLAIVPGALLVACGSTDVPSHSPSPGLEERLAHASLVRGLRCAGVARPQLATSAPAWRLRYSVLGEGGADAAVLVELFADGRVTLVTGADTQVRATSPSQAARLAQLIDASDLLCVAEVPVARVRPAGNYRRTVSISNGGYAKTMSADACYEVTDRLAWAQVTAALDTLLGTIAPLPATSGGAPLDRACNDAELAAVGTLDLRERDLLARLAH